MRKVKVLLFSVAILVGLLLASSVVASAVVVDPREAIKLGPEGQFSGLGGINLSSLVSGLVKLVMVIAAIVFFFVLVMGGIQWIVSGGDKTGAETARKRITAALVGLAIVFVAWAIAALVNSLFGVDIFKLQIPILYKEGTVIPTPVP